MKQTTRKSSNPDTVKAPCSVTSPPVYPFAALVGQDEMKLALLLNVIEPAIGGALIMGERGTGKTTAVRALAELLPPLATVRDCAYNCDPVAEAQLCADCQARLRAEGSLPRVRRRVPVVELPLNATEDRVCGTLSLARALAAGVKEFEPGLLAHANRGFLYIDEVNLLEDYLVDLLLDAAASGRNRVEREGVSVTHPARFVLVGSGNPEEGELRPQLVDRFGLFVASKTPASVDERVEIVARHEAFARDPPAFCAKLETEQARLRRRIVRARAAVAHVSVARPLLRRVAELCQRLQVDGHRGELTIARAARALAAFAGRRAATDADVRRVAPLALQHRLRRDPLAQTTSSAQLEQTIEELFGLEAQAETQSPSQPLIVELEHADAARDDDDDAGGRAAQRPARAADGRAGESSGTERSAPPVETPLIIELRATDAAKRLTLPRSAARRQTSGRASVAAQRGRYVRATARLIERPRLALDATINAAVARQGTRAPAQGRALGFAREDLRFKQFSRRAGTLFIFAVDTSGSMAVNRINQAKGALVTLLRQSYVNRDEVALVSFRAQHAELLLRPSRSTAAARRLLDALPVGGATPLAAGLLRAYELARLARSAHGRIVLLVFTDGRANVPLDCRTDGPRPALRMRIEHELRHVGALLRRAAVNTFIVDTRQRFAAGDEGERLARTVGGHYVALPAPLPASASTQTL
ncbi:MAG TPA: magnesium chelatase ATPase subunit I [Pyrinomonadaceae bacterium]|jgi:magnesium chelatase subunit D